MRIQSKWIILQLTSLLCYTTLFPAIFSAVPLALFRIEAPKKYYYSFLACTNAILISYFGFIKTEGIAFALGYSIVCFWGTLAAELLLKYYGLRKETSESTKNNFWQMYLGLGILPLLVMLLGSFLYIHTVFPGETPFALANRFATKILSEQSTVDVLKELKKSTAPEAEQVINLLENPKAFASQLLFVVPSYLFSAYFILAFFTLFFLSRLSHFSAGYIGSDWPKTIVYEYRNPDFFIVLAIILLAWSLFFEQLPLNEFWIKHGAILGSSLISVIGVFFFFQGLMVCLHLLDRWGIKGFLGAIILFVILLLVTKAVAVLGLIDMWVDIRNKKFGLENKNR